MSRHHRRMHGGFNNFGYPAREMSTNLNGEHVIGDSIQPNLFQYAPKQYSENLNQGPVQFEFSMSPNMEWIPSKSYFLLNTELTVANTGGGSRAPLPGDNICYSNFLPGQIINDVRFELANRTISIQNTNAPQTYALYNRMAYGGGFLENNKDIFYYYPDIKDRINDVTWGSDPDNQIAPLLNTNPSAVAGSIRYETKSQAFDNFVQRITKDDLTLADNNIFGSFNDVSCGLQTGDMIIVNDGDVYKSYFVTNVANNGYTCTITPQPTALDNIACNLVSIIRKNKSDKFRNRNKKLVAYQCPLGVFQLSSGITCSNVRIVLNPYSDWYNRAVQQIYPRLADDGSGMFSTTRSYNITPGTANSYNIIVKQMQFYAYMQARTTPVPQELTMKTLESQVFRKTITSPLSVNEQFSVPASTKFVVVFFQDSQCADVTQNVFVPGTSANCGNYLSAVDFRNYNNTTSTLKTLSIQIGDLKFPITDQTQILTQVPVFSNGNALSTLSVENDQIERYLDTQVVTSKFFSDAGSESYENFIKSPYYCFLVAQPANSWNTVLQVRATFGTSPDSACTKSGGSAQNDINLYVVSFFEKIAQITTENGLVTQVSTSEV